MVFYHGTQNTLKIIFFFGLTIIVMLMLMHDLIEILMVSKNVRSMEYYPIPLILLNTGMPNSDLKQPFINTTPKNKIVDKLVAVSGSSGSPRKENLNESNLQLNRSNLFDQNMGRSRLASTGRLTNYNKTD